MKKIKRFTIFCVCLALCVGMLGVFPTSASVDRVGDFEFDTHESGEIFISAYYGKQTSLTLPSTFNGKPVVGIESNIFEYDASQSVTELTIPKSITKIYAQAFSTAAALTTVHIEGKIEEVSTHSFDLFKIKQNPDNVDEYGNVYVGNILVSMQQVDGICRVREGTVTIAEEALEDWVPVREIYFPASLSYVCDEACYANKTLEKVVFTEGDPLSIARIAFAGCTALKDITLTNNTYYVGSGAFNNTAYTNDTANWKKGILYCGPVVLKTKLKTSQVKVTLREGTTLLACGAFYGLQKTPFRLIMPDTVRWINDWCFEKSNVAQIVFSKNLETIGKYAFYYCRKLVSVELPEGLKTIPERAFFECGDLRSVELPTTLKKVNKYAFKSTALVLVKYRGTDTQFGKITIRTGNAKLKEAYRVNDYVDDCTHPEGQNFVALRPTEKRATRINRMCVYCGKAYDFFTTNKSVKVETIFKDVSTKDWFYSAADFAYNYNAFKGTTATTFSPNQKMTRGMFVTVLMRLSGNEYDNKQKTKFSDVPVGEYYTGAVRWATNAGIVNGMGKGRFEPNSTITREQLCKMIVNYTAYSGTQIYHDEYVTYFADDAAISSWARNSVYICKATKLVSGKANNVFDPTAYATRAEVATILYRLQEKFMYLN